VTRPPARTLVLDEGLNPRLAVELAARGRAAASVSALGLGGAGDLALLDALDDRLGDWVLVTADEGLPEGREAQLRAARRTIATLGAEPEAEWALDAWRREVVHRWAHAMHGQPRGTLRRYALRHEGAWRPRRHRPHR
jgi:hydrogenase maturation factor